ncbi:MAG: DNA/RNA non-specific endonuclease, partial [Bacteroidetes bacterium]
TDTLANGKVKYDGFGYDRGHLAPSADFRWSAQALSESYFYSNMSPQVADFNRGGWADLEAHLRGYVYDHPHSELYIVTGPLLTDSLAVIERGVNKVSIPDTFFKVALDLRAGQAIGFLMPNRALTYPIDHYAVTVDEVERVTGLDFFPALAEAAAIEAHLDKAYWFEALAQGDVEPLYPPSLPRDHFNTIQARDHMNSGKAVVICGKVVSARYSRAGHVWLNLDKRYPNDICSVMIRKEDLVHFSGDPSELFKGKVIAVKGKIFPLSGKPVVSLKREEDVQDLADAL